MTPMRRLDHWMTYSRTAPLLFAVLCFAGAAALFLTHRVTMNQPGCVCR